MDVSNNLRETIIRLHTQEKLGIKAISAWFNGHPGKTKIARILQDAGVYQGPNRMAEQHAMRLARQQRIIQNEKQKRCRMAYCLRELRKGSRADFRVGDTLIECKVDVRTGSMNEALGQALLYQISTGLNVILLLPDDVTPLEIHLAAMKRINVQVWRISGMEHKMKEGVVKESFNCQ